MIEDLKTDYKSDILMPAQQNKRTFNIVDSNNNILFENVHIEDNSQYLQVGDEYGSEVINAQNEAINTLARGTGLTFDTYQDYLDARALGEVPVGSIIYILEGNQTVITANQVTYNSSNVKLALDTLVEKTIKKRATSSSVTTKTRKEKLTELYTACTQATAAQLANATILMNMSNSPGRYYCFKFYSNESSNYGYRFLQFQQNTDKNIAIRGINVNSTSANSAQYITIAGASSSITDQGDTADGVYFELYY